MTNISSDKQFATINQPEQIYIEENRAPYNRSIKGQLEGERRESGCDRCIQILCCCTLCASCFNNWCTCFQIIAECCA